MVIKSTTSSRQVDLWIQNQQFLSILWCKMQKRSKNIFLCIFESISADPFVLNSKSTQEDDLRIHWKFGTCFYIPYYKRILSMKKRKTCFTKVLIYLLKSSAPTQLRAKLALISINPATHPTTGQVWRS